MKTGAIVASVLVAGLAVACIYYSQRKEKALEDETKTFATDTVNAISESWNADALIDRAEPGLVKAMAGQGQNIEDLFRVWQKLGNLQSDPDCSLKDISTFEGTTDSYTTASYSCEAHYQNGHATLLITARRGQQSDGWKVYYINISSPYFAALNYPRTK